MPKRYTNESTNLEILAEECAEVSQIKSKIVRFGLDDTYPARGMSNRQALELELGHVLTMIHILCEQGTISYDNVLAGADSKLEKMVNWYPSAGVVA